MNSEGKEWEGISTVWPLKRHYLVHICVPTERPASQSIPRKLNFRIPINPSSINGHCLHNPQWQGSQNAFRAARGSPCWRRQGEHPLGEARDGRAPRSTGFCPPGNAATAACRAAPGVVVAPHPAGRARAGTRSKAEDEKAGTCDLPFPPSKFCLIFFASCVNSRSYLGCEKTANR